MKILHIGLVDDRRFSGVATVVPNYLYHQAKHASVALLNLANFTPKNSTDTYKTYLYKESSLRATLDSFGKPDLVVFHEVYHIEFIKIAKILRVLEIPYIITPHVSLTDTAQEHKRLKKYIGNALFFNHFINHSAAIHYLSKSEKDQSSHFNTLKSFICGNGIELKGRLKKQFNKDNLKLIYVGRLEIKIKGIDRILDAVNDSQEEFRVKNITISIRGYDEASNLGKIRSVINRYRIGDIVSLDGPLFGTEKLETILEHDCFIQLSRTEGQPLSIMEAMDIGMPCIVTEGTTFFDIVKESSAGISVPNQPEGIAKSLLHIEKTSLIRMSKNATRYAGNNFSWQTIGKTMIMQYASIVDPNRTSKTEPPCS